MKKEKIYTSIYGLQPAGLCEKPEDYHYSSAKFYLDGTNSFEILKHFSRN